MGRPKGRSVAAIVLALSVAGLAASGSVPAWSSVPPPGTTSSPYAFTTGLPWADTNGNLVQGHNGSVLKPSGGSSYYWVGQNLANTGKRQDAACYQSADLVHWTPVTGFSLSVSSLTLPGDAQTGAFWVIGTTKLIEASSGHFVIWASMKLKQPNGSNSDFDLDVATSSSPCGSYTWQNQAPWQPVSAGTGHPVGDIGIFQDSNSPGTGTVYLLTSDSGGGSCTSGTANCIVPLTNPPAPNVTPCPSGETDCVFEAGVRIFQLQSGDTQVQGTSSVFDIHQRNGEGLEAPAMFKNLSTNTYYVLMSETTSWKPNQNWYSSSSSPSGGWSAISPIYVPASSTAGPTCDSQTMWVQPLQGSAATNYIYMADRWDSSNISDGANGADSLGDSSYVWLPLLFTNGSSLTTSGTVPTLDCTVHNWSINTSSGKWANLGPSVPDAMFTLTNVGSGQAMEADGSGKANPAFQAGSNGHLQQQWQIIEVTYTPSGSGFTPRYEIQNVSSGKVLQDDGGTVDQASAGGTNQETCTGATAGDTSALPADQVWQFVSVNNGSGTPEGLMLKNICTGKVAEVSSDGTTLDTASAAAPPTLGQQWALAEVPGYWSITSEGNIYNTAGTPWFGSRAANNINDAVGLAPTPDGSGYWMTESNGTVTNYGDAANHGNITFSSNPSCTPIGTTADPGQDGFWAFDTCGNVYGYGNANPIAGQTIPSSAFIVGMAATPDGGGYWLVDQNGTVYEFGDAGTGTFSIGNSNPVVNVATDPAGGFWALTDMGAVFGEAGATSLGGEGRLDQVADWAIAVTADGGGYWLFEQTTGPSPVTVYHFGDATDGTQTQVGSGNLEPAVGNPNM